MSTTIKVDHILILAAGKGTRMGGIGQKLPKLLWPIFEKRLIDLQVDYAKKISPQAKIYINVFNYSEEILHYIKHSGTKDHVEVLIENERLDIGGTIHNLASKIKYKGNLLILNGDQFLSLRSKDFDKGLDLLLESDSILFSYNVNSNDGYNALQIKNDLLCGIIKNEALEKNQQIVTYTGTSLINLERLDKKSGESKFFETVANFKKAKVKVLNIDNLEYWDFGTVNRYYESMMGLLKQPNSWFYNFLENQNALDHKKIYKSCYNSTSGINLSSQANVDCGKTICFDEQVESLDRDKKGILYRNIFEEVYSDL